MAYQKRKQRTTIWRSNFRHNIPDYEENWQELAVAVVMQALKDYVANEHKTSDAAVRLFNDAKSFLFSKRIEIYTTVSVDYLINGMRRNMYGEKTKHSKEKNRRGL